MRNLLKYRGILNSQMGVYVTDLPALPSPAPQGESIDIPGRNGSIWKGTGAYEDIVLAPTMWIPPSRVSNMSNIKAWLTGQGDLIPDGIGSWRLKARIDEGIQWAPVGRDDGYTASVPFVCGPFFYTLSPYTQTLNVAGSINNPYSVYAEPKLTIVASGDVEITVGDTVFELTGVSGTIYVDTDAMECYTSGGLENNKMTGPFPTLQPGANSISWTGTVSSIKVDVYWRRL